MNTTSDSLLGRRKKPASHLLTNEPFTMHSLFVTCPIEALMQGIYQARTTMDELTSRGDFGIGTFNHLDGEMIVHEGEIFRADSSGAIRRVSLDIATPFAAVTFFAPDTVESFESPIPEEEFGTFLKGLIPSENMVYAVRIQGLFSLVHARSVPAQEDGRPLVEVTRIQSEFNFTDITGTLLGFYTPEFIKSLVVPGFHLHFLSDDRTVGGHLLGCSMVSGIVAIQHVPEISVGLPLTLDFLTADLSSDVSGDIHEAERARK
jgi:acetolactate decarboxylase